MATSKVRKGKRKVEGSEFFFQRTVEKAKGMKSLEAPLMDNVSAARAQQCMPRYGVSTIVLYRCRVVLLPPAVLMNNIIACSGPNG